jgi:hypothetical protein
VQLFFLESLMGAFWTVGDPHHLVGLNNKLRRMLSLSTCLHINLLGYMLPNLGNIIPFEIYISSLKS